MSLLGGPENDRIILDLPLGDKIAEGGEGIDILDTSAVASGLQFDFRFGLQIVSERDSFGFARFSGFERYQLGDGDDLVRWVLDGDIKGVTFDAGGGARDVFRVTDARYGTSTTVTGFDFASGELKANDKFDEVVVIATLSGFDVMNFDVDGDYSVTGTARNETVIIRGAGDNLVQTFGGDDELIGGAGRDILDGGEGRDVVIYTDATSGVVVYLAHSGRDVGGGQGRDTLRGIEDVIGSFHDDRLVGDVGNNVLTGLNGNDILIGGDGDDQLFGGTENDLLRGGSGADHLLGDEGQDRLFGLTGEDTLTGGSEADYLYGGRDDDSLFGDEGADRLRGNLGNDLLFGGAEQDDLRGGGGNDGLYGEDGDDYLIGENGRDILVGGAGSDVLVGGRGAGVLDGLMDVFVFTTLEADMNTFDRIKDFEDGIDKIGLDGFGYTDFLSEVVPLARDTASGMRLNLPDANVVFFEGFFLENFDAGDVIFS